MDDVDLSERFNGMPIPARQALFNLYSAYANRGLYAYDQQTILSLLGGDKDDVSIKVKLLLDETFMLKTRTGYKLDRQKADSLITMDVLSTDSENPQIRRMNAVREEPPEKNQEKDQDMDNMEIPEPTFVDQDDPSLLDLNLPIAEGYVFREFEEIDISNQESTDPERLSGEDFEVKVEPKGKNTRFNLIEIMDRSDAGHKIEPPMWLVHDTSINKIYLIAQKGLKFADPDNSVYVGTKQLQFLQQNPHYILGTFADKDKAKEHCSKFYDTTINEKSVIGYLPHRVGEVFWVLQKASNGTYCVLPRNAIPPYTMEKRKVEDLTHDEAIAVFVASEKKAEEKTVDKAESAISPSVLDHRYSGDEDFKASLADTLEGINDVHMEDVLKDTKLEKKLNEATAPEHVPAPDDSEESMQALKDLVQEVIANGDMDSLHDAYNMVAKSYAHILDKTKYCRMITDRIKQLRNVGNVPRRAPEGSPGYIRQGHGRHPGA